MKRKLIASLKHEVHMLEVASLPHEFEKHLYAIEQLTALLKEDKFSTHKEQPTQPSKHSNNQTVSDQEMLQMMGFNKVNRDKTEEYQSDSIFDF